MTARCATETTTQARSAVVYRDRDELLSENRALRRQVAALEELLALEPARRDYDASALPRREAALLHLLMLRPRVTKEQALARLEAHAPSLVSIERSEEHVEQAATCLRRILRPLGADVRSRRYGGYWLEPADKAARTAAFPRPDVPHPRSNP